MAGVGGLKHSGFWLALILAGHFALAAGFGLAMPLFEEYDEASHVLFVRYLQAYGRLPIQDTNGEGARAHHPPGYYALGALLTAWVPVEGAVDAIRPEPNPNFRIEPGDTERDNKARWVHGFPDERFPYAGLARLTHVLRLLSAAFSTLAVALTFAAARRLRPDDPAFALLAAGLLGFNPDVAFLGGLVYNDTAALAGGAAVLYALTHFERQGFTTRRWAIVGLVFGLGVLLKLNVLTLAVPLGLLWLWEAARVWSIRNDLKQALAVGVPFLLVTGWWFARNQVLYGDWTANASIVKLWGEVKPEQKNLLAQAVSLLQDPLGRFGTGEWVSFPAPLYVIASLVIVLALLAAGLAAARYLADRWQAAKTEPGLWPRARAAWARAELETPARLWVIHAVAAAAIVSSVLYYAVSVVGWTMSRFLYPAYLSIALLLAAGLLVPFRARARAWAAGIVLAVNAGLAAYALFGLVVPTYAPPRAPRPVELRQMTPLDAEIGGVARVLGYTIDAESSSAAGVVEVTVYWEPIARTDVPYTVFIHVFDPSQGSLAQRDTYPGGGNWATHVWDPGRPFVETYRLHLPADLSTASGTILLGLYDRNTGARLPVQGADAVPEESWIQFGDVRWQP